MAEAASPLPPQFTSQFLARLETLRVRTRRRFLGGRPGGHLSPRRGAGLEFADYRPYAPGDDPRYIDWKLYSRTDRPYIKLFQEEEDLYTYLFVDYSASMAYPSGNGKDMAARDLALALAYVVLASGDAVQLHALNGEGEETPRHFFAGGSGSLTCRCFSRDKRPTARWLLPRLSRSIYKQYIGPAKRSGSPISCFR